MIVSQELFCPRQGLRFFFTVCGEKRRKRQEERKEGRKKTGEGKGWREGGKGGREGKETHENVSRVLSG